MLEYRRNFVPGETYFFTVVTEHRLPLFQHETARRLLANVLRECIVRHPLEMIALVLLPDHLHTLWTLPLDDADYSLRWRWIKREFTRAWLRVGGIESKPSATRVREYRRGVWQRRFWEHTIRDEADLESYFDYVHYNPVKHGFVERPGDWPWSSFHRYVREGHYPPDWAVVAPPTRIPRDTGE